MDLTEPQWLAIKDGMPLPHQGRGRPSLDPLLLLNGIFWKIRTGYPWRALPDRYPSYQSCHRFYEQWQASGLLFSLVQSLYSDLVYRADFTPYIAVFERRIFLRIRGRSFGFIVVPRYRDDWRTSTALLFLQYELQKIRMRIISGSITDRFEMTGIQRLEFRFGLWEKYAPLRLDGKYSGTYYDPEDVIYKIVKGSCIPILENPWKYSLDNSDDFEVSDDSA
jgi:hypothetical protein